MPGAVGTRREASVSLDDLRDLAVAGKWLQFWCWPVAVSGILSGVQLIAIAVLLFTGARDKILIVALIGTPISLLPFYFAWQALHGGDRGADAE